MNRESISIQNNYKPPFFIVKIYIWSIIFEQLVFFSFGASGDKFGIPLSFSRFLQFFILLFLFYTYIIRNFKLNLKFDKYFTTYFIITLISTILSFLFFKTYDLDFNIIAGIQTILKGKYIRPFFDMFITLYYYFYFIILPSFFISNKNSLDYYISKTFFVLKLFLILGFLDLFISPLIGQALITRHIDDSIDVGFRFHSFGGEPRETFVFLTFNLVLLIFLNFTNYKIKNYKMYIIFIIISLILTQSSSGIFGFLFGSFIALIYFVFKKSKKAIYTFSIITIVFFILLYLIQFSDRTIAYLEAFKDLIDILKSGVELPYLLVQTAVNFLPLWDLILQLSNFDFLHAFFGSGFNACAFYNMKYFKMPDFSNPHAQITILLFDSGIICFYFYLLFITKPFLNFFKYISSSKKFTPFIIFFLFIGSSLAHRSLSPLILIGLINTYIFFKRNIQPNS